MRGKGILTIMITAGLISVSAFFTSYSSPANNMERYISEARLLQKPVLEYGGVTVTPQGWTTEEGDDSFFGHPAAVNVEFLAENHSKQPVTVSHFRLYINGQYIRHSLMSQTGRIPPGGSEIWTVEIEYHSLQSQRIKTINDFGAAFLIRFEEDKSTYYSDVVPVLSDSRAGDGLSDMAGMKVYEDEELTLTAGSAFREFPGAYDIPVHAENHSTEYVASLNGRILAVNGETVEKGSLLDINSSCFLYPGKTADINNIVFLKSEDASVQIPLKDIKSVTWRMTGIWMLRDQASGKFEKVKEAEPVEITIPIDSAAL